jgi:hypothetical protein
VFFSAVNLFPTVESLLPLHDGYMGTKTALPTVTPLMPKLWRLLVMKMQFLSSEFVSDAGPFVVFQVSVTRTACWVFSQGMWLHLHRSPLRHHRPVGDRGKPRQVRLETRQRDRALPGPCQTAEWSPRRAASMTRPTRSWENTTGGRFSALPYSDRARIAFRFSRTLIYGSCNKQSNDIII